jgi:hypothetical protein
MPPSCRRLAPPLLLAIAGAAVLVGCIPIPVYRPEGGGPRPESRIGPARSDKPLRVGGATREDVVRVLGPPSPELDTRDAMIYSYGITSIFWFPCFRQYESRFLRLEFDDRGNLRDYGVFKSISQAKRPLAHR